MKCCLYILSLLLILFPAADASGKRNIVDMPFLQVRVDKNSVVEGERLIYEVVLFTPDPNVAGVEMLREPRMSMLPYTRSAADTQLQEVEINGRKYYSAVIDRYFIGVNDKGKYTIGGGEYRLGLARRERVDDPIWGPVIRDHVVPVDMKAPSLSVRAKSLPEKDRPVGFSGAVGRFDVFVAVPEGKVREGEDMEIVINISGYGDLTSTPLPEIRKMLPEGLKFKSMTDSRSHYVKNGHLGSEIEIECILTPEKEGKFTIDDISFSYFNTESGRYSIARAPAVVVEVEEGIPSDGTPPVIIDV